MLSGAYNTLQLVYIFAVWRASQIKKIPDLDSGQCLARIILPSSGHTHASINLFYKSENVETNFIFELNRTL